MKRVLRARANQREGQLVGIRLSFDKIRVLHHIAEKSVSRESLQERLRNHEFPIDARKLQRIMRGLVCVGWAASTPPASGSGHKYSLTPLGREALKVARAGLGKLSASFEQSET